MSGIAMALLSGGGGAAYSLQTDTHADYGFDPNSSQITYTVNSNGSVSVDGSNYGNLSAYDWITPKPPVSTHYVRVTPTSGSLSSGATGTWLALSSSKAWTLKQVGPGAKSCTFTVEIATDSGGVNIVASASVSLNVSVEI